MTMIQKKLSKVCLLNKKNYCRSLVLNGKKKGIGFIFAFQGFKHALLYERNFQLQVLSGLLVVIVSFALNLSPIEWAMIVLVIGSVLSLEIINSAVERLLDYVKPEIHPQAKIIKDMLASAVLIISFVALLIGLIILSPKLTSLLIK